LSRFKVDLISTVLQHGVGVIAGSAVYNGFRRSSENLLSPALSSGFARKRGRCGYYVLMKGSTDSGAFVVDERNAPVGAKMGQSGSFALPVVGGAVLPVRLENRSGKASGFCRVSGPLSL